MFSGLLIVPRIATLGRSLRRFHVAAAVGALMASLLSACGIPPAAAFFIRPGAPSGATAGGPQIALQRTFNNPNANATGSTAFWMIGQPFKPDEVPWGDVVTATLGGTSVPVSCASRKYAADGSLEWCQLLVDFSGASISAGGSAMLQLTAAPGTWCDAQGTGTCTSGFSKGEWDGLGDTVTLSSLTASSGSTAATVQGSGTWNAKFDGGPTNTETVLADTPQGREVSVAANLRDTTSISATATGSTTLTITPAQTLAGNDSVVLNGSSGQLGLCTNATGVSGSSFSCTNVSSVNAASVTSISPINRNIQVVMYYWETKKQNGSAGPVESWGPFIENVLIYPKTASPYYGNSTLTAYSFNIAYDRGAIKVRDCATATAYCSVSLPAQAIADPVRADAQGDWSASDPGIYVTQDYGLVVNTRKIPPFTKSIPYAGNQISASAPLTGISGATLAFNGADFMGQNPTYQLVDFASVGSLTGVSAGVIYGAAPATSAHLCLYDNITDARASGNPSSCTGTGLITPGGSATGAALENSAGPTSPGQYDVSIQDGGGRPDLSLTTEWGAAYLVGNTQAWQRIGRVMAYDWSSFVIYGIEASTGHIPCLIDAQGTSGSGDTGCPATSGALGTAYPNDSWTNAFSSDINNGAAPTGGTVPWTTGVGDPEHYPNGVYISWLMEGSPFLRDLLMLMANGELANTGTGSRNNQVTSSGSTYHGVIVSGLLIQMRSSAWKVRDAMYAAFAAPQGSPEESYFRTIMTSSLAWAAAYRSYKGTNYQNLGYQGVDEANYENPINQADNTIQNQEAENFMDTYYAAAMALSQILEGDYVTGIAADNTFQFQWLNSSYGAGKCPWYAPIYVRTPGQNYNGYSGLPGNYVTQNQPSLTANAGVGFTNGNGLYINFASGSTTLQAQASNQLPWTLAAGDKIRFYNFDTSGNSFATLGPAPPTNFTMGQDYYIESPSGTSFQVSATNGGAAISANATVTGVNAALIPSGQASCPPGSWAPTNQTDNYFIYQLTALALMDEAGVSGAPTAYTNAAALWTGGSGGSSVCATEMMWCMTPP
jgi:hypothetical protein